MIALNADTKSKKPDDSKFSLESSIEMGDLKCKLYESFMDYISTAVNKNEFAKIIELHQLKIKHTDYTNLFNEMASALLKIRDKLGSSSACDALLPTKHLWLTLIGSRLNVAYLNDLIKCLQSEPKTEEFEKKIQLYNMVGNYYDMTNLMTNSSYTTYKQWGPKYFNFTVVCSDICHSTKFSTHRFLMKEILSIMTPLEDEDFVNHWFQFAKSLCELNNPELIDILLSLR